MPGVPNKEKRQKTGRSPSPSSSENDSDSDEEGGIRIGGVYVPPPPKALCSSETAGPRLIIHKIVNYNFKSYAGRQVLGPFHKSFTSIIGPNGSGKSNVIDSMLFVFGYRATKIRSKKLSVLIHKSENHQNLRSCTVEVHFHQIQDKEGNDYDIIPNTELVIGRTASMDNTSYYTVNNKKSNIKQVAAILGSHGIDLVHNRFLILQGEVEQIAMMKPKALTEHETGMLEYLEDIIGTRRYKKPLRKLEVKVEELSNIRNEKFNKLKLAESEQKALLEPFEDAKQYLKLSNRNAFFSNQLIQKKIHEYKKTLNGVQSEKDELDKKVEDLKTQQETLEQENYHKEKERKDRKKLIEEKIAEKDKLKDEFHKIENDQTKLNEEIKLTNKKRKKTKEALQTEKEKLAEAQKVPEKNKKEIEKLKKTEEDLKVDVQSKEKTVESILASIGEKTKKLRDEKDAINDELIGLNNIKDSAKAKYNLAKTELEAYQNNEKTEKAKLEKMKGDLDANSASFKEKTSTYEGLKTKLPAAEADLQKYQKELANIKPLEKKTTEKLYSLRSQVEEKRVSYQANRSRNRVLEFVMDQKQKGVLPGVFGRLGDLGGIDGKYDCAVSTACGPLDYIVTDTVRTAKQCVELLKKHDVGRGNFIALDQQEGLKSQYQRTFKTPENIPRLFDLIKVNDERVKPAFYFGLRDTLVANDLGQAKRCAYGATRYRVVTLGGEIIEIAGTMSGGGKEKKMGRMGRSATVVNESFSADLETEIAELQQKSMDMRNRISYLEEQIGILFRDTKAWSAQMKSLEIDIKAFTQGEIDLKKRIKEQSTVVKNAISNPEEVARLSEKVKKTKIVYDEASENSGKLELKVAALTKKIDELTGGKMKEAQAKLDQVTADMKAVCEKISKCTVGIQTSMRNCKKHERQIEDYTAEIASCESKLEEADVKLQEFLRIGQLMNEKMTVLKAQIEEDEEKMKKMETGRDYLTEINAIKASLMKEKQTIDALKSKISESKLKIDAQKTQLEKLVVYEIPGEEEEGDGDEEEEGHHVKELREIPAEELESLDFEFIKYEYDQTSQALQRSNANQHLQVVEDYKAMTENVKKRSEELVEASNLRDEVRQGFEELKQARTKEFMTGFIIISSKLKEMYQMITLGGDAEFDLMDTLDPFSEGVVFTVRPPRKSWKRISNLSGGEKTLSSLALVFALHYYKPSPLYVMDEIDAALDFKNVSIVAHYIKERTKNAQFIIISLRSNMFELADLLVGIYKTFNCTKSVTITPGHYAPEENQVNQPREEANERRNDVVPSTAGVSRPSGSRNFVAPKPPTARNPSIDESFDTSREVSFSSAQAGSHSLPPSDSSDDDRQPRKKRRSHDKE